MYARRGLGMGRPFPNVQAWGRHCADNNAGAQGEKDKWHGEVRLGGALGAGAAGAGGCA